MTAGAQDWIHDGAVRAAAWSADGTRIATGASDGMVRVWDAEAGQLAPREPTWRDPSARRCLRGRTHTSRLPGYEPEDRPVDISAGWYTATLSGGRFDIVRDGPEITFCTGSYTVHGDRVRLLAERADAGDLREACFAGRTFLDARFELTDGELRLSDPYASLVDASLFTARPLERVD